MLQFEWDTVDFDNSDENVRPQFEQEIKTRKLNKITGEIEPYLSLPARLFSYLLSSSVVVLMVSCVLVSMVAIITYRTVLKYALRHAPASLSSTVPSITGACINLVIIVVLGKFYEWIAVKLTNMEHHKTDTQYETALSIKVYMFQFTNFYSSIFYVAFFKGAVITRDQYLNEFCDSDYCLTEAFIQMVIIMVGKQLANNFQELVWPSILIYFNKNKEIQLTESSKQWEKDYKLLGWTNLTLFDEYLEMGEF